MHGTALHCKPVGLGQAVKRQAGREGETKTGTETRLVVSVDWTVN